MKTVSILALSALLALTNASIDKFPKFDSFHTHCMLDVTYPNRVCSQVFSSMGGILESFSGSDPMKGKYTMKE